MKNYFISCWAIMALTVFSFSSHADTCVNGKNCSEKSLKRNGRDRDRSSGNSRNSRNTSRDRGTNSNARNDRDRSQSTSRNRNTTVRTQRDRNYSTQRNRSTANSRSRVNRQTSAHRNYGHRPNWNRQQSRYVRNTHRSYSYNRAHHRRWNTRRSYYQSVSFRDIYWDRWLRVRVTWTNGYSWYNNYPWFSYNGYRHRYSNVDLCDYELVDGFNNTVEQTFHNYTCSYGYDQCAELRDSMNNWSSDYRYFCSEKLEGSIDDYGYNYDDDFYSDVYSDRDSDSWDSDFEDEWN